MIAEEKARLQKQYEHQAHIENQEKARIAREKELSI
jgi:hypothetical protein